MSLKWKKNDVEQEWFWKSFIKMKNITDTLVDYFNRRSRPVHAASHMCWFTLISKIKTSVLQLVLFQVLSSHM